MKLDKETIIIGGLPHPIGGVTTFLSRLSKVYSDYIVEFIDLYPHENKLVPKQLAEKYIVIKNKVLVQLKIIHLQAKYQRHDLFFNFSTTKSLLFFATLPKFRNTWSLMLHHGDLSNQIPKPLLRYILSKFDIIYTLNARQEDFYKSVSPDLPLTRGSSYVPATLVDISNNEKTPLFDVKKSGFKIITGSGFPRPLYQHHLLIDLIDKNINTHLFLFLYGEGELKESLKNINHPRVTVFLNKSEDIFNYYLSQSDIYIRPTLEDSFGIACADAVEFGVPVLASNVCKRYRGVQTFETNDISDLNSKLNELLT